jgi:hypothetical protein
VVFAVARELSQGFDHPGMNSEHNRVPPPPHYSEQEIWRREYREAMEAEWRVERARLEAEKESALEAQKEALAQQLKERVERRHPSPAPPGYPTLETSGTGSPKKVRV